jgi:hypothetical protein
MYKYSFLSGNSENISSSLSSAINQINALRGTIVQIIQSQSTGQSGMTMVSITIIYTIK